MLTDDPTGQTRYGGFREPLDVSEYVARVEGSMASPYGANTATYAQTRPLEPETPLLFGNEEMADVSTCTDLVVQPEVIWDVNSYYRLLGIPFPYRPVTRRDLKLAYHAVNGESDPKIAYALDQLLDRTVGLDGRTTRQRYDAMPLGEPMMDRWMDEYIRNEAQKEAHRRVARGEMAAEDAEGDLGMNSVLSEWGAHLVRPGDEEPLPAAPPPSSRTVHLTWSYYLWRCSYQTVSALTPRLDAWRTMLVEEFRALGIRLKFRVGFLGKNPHPWMRVEWNGHLVFFLNSDQVPTKEYAAQAAEMTQRELGTHRHLTIEENPNGSA